MKIKALTPGKAILACGVCLLVAGVAAAQTATPAAKPAVAASPAPKTKPHHDGQFAPHAPSFDDLDANHDGVVSKAEFDAWRAAHPHPDRPGPDRQGPDHQGPDHQGLGGDDRHGDWHEGFEMRREMMWMRMPEMEMHHGHGGRFGRPVDLEAADTDHDGKISWAEFQAAAAARLKARFDRMDANHDGFIEKEELPGHGEHHNWHHEGKDDKAAANPTPASPVK